MTYAQNLIDRARSFGRDDGGGFIDDADYITWLNEASFDLAARLQLFEEEETTTTSGNSVALPTSPELVEIQYVLLGTSDHVRFVSGEEWDSNVDAGSSPVNTLAQIYDRVISFYPTPAAGTLVTMRYKMLPVLLTVGEDTITLPSHLERKMVEFACSRARYKDGDFNGGNNWNILYEKGLPSVSTGREPLFTQPLQLQRAQNIFDADPRASHL